MDRNLKVLITGVGSPGAPGVIKSLRLNREIKFQIYGMDIDSRASGKALVDSFFIAPKASDPDFVDKILDICTSEKIDVILPLVSLELPHFSKHQNDFREIGTNVSVSKLEGLEIAINKGTLFRFLEQKGFDVPRYQVVQTVEDLRQAI